MPMKLARLDEEAQPGDEADRLYRKAGDAVEGEVQHFSADNGFRLQCARRALVIYAGDRPPPGAQGRAETGVHLFRELRASLSSAPAHQRWRGYINRASRPAFITFIEALGWRVRAETGVRLALPSARWHTITRCKVFVYHFYPGRHGVITARRQSMEMVTSRHVPAVINPASRAFWWPRLREAAQTPAKNARPKSGKL